MSKGSPSLVALLGLLAVAGYQNRDKLGKLIEGGQPGGSQPDQQDTASGGFGDGLQRLLADTGMGGIPGALQELIGRFTGPDQSAKAQSWVATGSNAPINPDDLTGVLDDETLTELEQKTGLTRQELLARLSTNLPDAVDRMTPNGRIPTDEEATSIY